MQARHRQTDRKTLLTPLFFTLKKWYEWVVEAEKMMDKTLLIFHDTNLHLHLYL